jgi:hypothetical protein
MTSKISFVIGEKGKDVFPTYYVEDNLIYAVHEKKAYMGDRSNKVCRFCHRNASSVTFRQEAHLLPEFMGNKNLLSNFECDECNARFSQYETAFADYFRIHHTFVRLKGKKKIPAFDSKKEKFSVVAEEEVIRVRSGQGNDSVTIDEQAQLMKIKTIRPPYVPCDVLKCLVKIGLCAVRESELSYFEETRKWLMGEAGESPHVTAPYSILYYNIGGGLRTQSPFVGLLSKRKNMPVPQSAVIIAYEHLKFQFFMPFDKRDGTLFSGSKVLLPIQGHLVREREDGKGLDFFWKDLSGTEKIVGEEHIFAMGISDGQYIK